MDNPFTQTNLYGLENLAHIPGSVGASPIQYIGAFGQDVSQLIKFVECIGLVYFHLSF